MADKLFRDMTRALLDSKLARDPAYLRMPFCGPDFAMRYLHQVRLIPVGRRDRKDLIIQLEVHQAEAAEANAVNGLDPLMSDFVNNGEFVYNRRGWGRVKFIRRDGGVLWPDRYVLRATFEGEHFASVAAARTRLVEIEESTHRSGHLLLELPWSKIREAMAHGGRVDDTREHPRDILLERGRYVKRLRGNLYQPGTDEMGRPVLWVAGLPKLRGDACPDRDHMIVVPPDRNGVAVQLSATFLDNLVTVLTPSDDPNGTSFVQDLLAFSDYYRLRPEEMSDEESDEHTPSDGEEDE